MLAAIHAICFALDPILFPSLRADGGACAGVLRGACPERDHASASVDGQGSSVQLRADVRDVLPVAAGEAPPATAVPASTAAPAGACDDRLDAIEQRAFAETNDMHKTGFFAPEEDDSR